MDKVASTIAFRSIGYGFLHIFLCICYLWAKDNFSEARLFPVLLPLIVFGPLLFSLEIYWRFLRGVKKDD